MLEELGQLWLTEEQTIFEFR